MDRSGPCQITSSPQQRESVAVAVVASVLRGTNAPRRRKLPAVYSLTHHAPRTTRRTSDTQRTPQSTHIPHTPHSPHPHATRLQKTLRYEADKVMLSDHMPVMAEMTIDMLPHGKRGTHSGIIPWWYFVEVSTRDGLAA